MTFGALIVNNSGITQIDGASVNSKIIQTGSIAPVFFSTGSGINVYTYTINFSNSTNKYPNVYLYIPWIQANTGSTFKTLNASSTSIVIYAQVPNTLTAFNINYVLALGTSITANTSYGLNIYNSSGDVCYSSTAETQHYPSLIATWTLTSPVTTSVKSTVLTVPTPYVPYVDYFLFNTITGNQGNMYGVYNSLIPISVKKTGQYQYTVSTNSIAAGGSIGSFPTGTILSLVFQTTYFK